MKILLFVLLVAIALPLHAADFKKVIEGTTYCFTILHSPHQLPTNKNIHGNKTVDNRGAVAIGINSCDDGYGVWNRKKEQSIRLVLPTEVSYDGDKYVVTEIASRAFAGCEGLVSVTVPTTVTNIGDAAFADCPDLQTVVVNCDSVQISYNCMEGCGAIDSIVVGPTARCINPFAFSSVPNVKNIVFLAEQPSSMQSLFYANKGHASITFGSKVTVVPQFLCFNFSGLSSVEFAGDDSQVTIIGQYAFAGCTSVLDIVFPEKLAIIKSNAFAYCRFRSLDFTSANPPILDDAPFFGGDSTTRVTIPCGSLQTYTNSAVGRIFKNVSYVAGCPIDPLVQEVVYIHDTVYVHDTVYLPEEQFRQRFDELPSTTSNSMYDNVEVDVEHLIGDIDPAEYEKKIKRLLDLMKPEEKASAETYENRLGICQACHYLSEGTCGACGCFVELRAAAGSGRCPYKKW